MKERKARGLIYKQIKYDIIIWEERKTLVRRCKEVENKRKKKG